MRIRFGMPAHDRSMGEEVGVADGGAVLRGPMGNEIGRVTKAWTSPDGTKVMCEATIDDDAFESLVDLGAMRGITIDALDQDEEP